MPRVRRPTAPTTPTTKPAPARLPWFMDEHIVEAKAPPPEPSPDVLPPVVWMPAYIPTSGHVPQQLSTLVDMCTKGALHPLVARPAEPDDIDVDDWSERVRGSPITVIRPTATSEAVVDHVQDWIVIVQVRGTNVGTVRRVAQELVQYLKHTPPPTTLPAKDAALDAVLGPAHIIQQATSEHPESWSPKRKLSREAIEGVRLLHAKDPAHFSVKALSERFGVSVEGMRRILHSSWQPSPEAAQRQNARAHSQRNAREAEEMDALLPTTYPVRVEGLVSSADLAKEGRRAKSVASRGSGDWCLIDAGWCVVHVMTSEARERYRIEELWKA